MTGEYSLTKSRVSRARCLVEQMRVHGWDLKTGGAVCGLCGGIISAIVGSVLTAIAWFTGPVWNGLSLHRDGTVLLFLTIPLLIVGAHCLDLIDEQAEKAKRSRYNQISSQGSSYKEENNDLERD